MKILHKAKLKNQDRWIEGFYCSKQDTTYCFSEDYERNPVETHHYIIQDQMTDWGLPNILRPYKIDPETLCVFTGLTDRHKNKIWEYDIVEIVSSPKRSYRYLIWWNKEMCLMEAVPLDGIEFNGHDYWNGNYPQFYYETFCTMMQDPWGDFQDIKVIGNIIDNPELLEEK